MGTAVGDLVATLGMNTSPWSSAIGGAKQMLTQFKSDATAGISQLKNTMSSLGGHVGLGGVLAGGSAVAAIWKSVDAAGEAAKAQKKLGAALAAGGGDADTSAKQLIDYAGQLSKVTNFSKDATTAAMATMAVFKSRMSADTFQDGIKAAQNIASIMGGDLAETSKKVGMALADPVKGMKLLRSEGVLFSAEQQNQIKNAIKSNDLAGAQGMILKQIGATFGGSAEKMLNPMTQMKNQIGEIAVKFGTMLLPLTKGFAGAMTKGLATVMQWVDSLRERFAGVWQTVSELWAAFTSNPMLVSLVAVVPVVAIVIAAIASIAPAVIAVGASLAGAFAIITGPVGAVVAAIAIVGAALLYVGVEGDTMADKLQNVFQWIGEAIDTIAFTFRNFGAIARMTVNNLLLWFLDVFPSMEGPVRAVGEVFVGTWAGCKAFFSAVIDNMLAGLREIANAAKALGAGIQAAWEAIKSGDFSGVGSAFGDAFMKEFTKQADEKAPNAMQAFKDAYKNAAGAFDKSVTDSGGMKKWLEERNKTFADQVAENETAFKLRERKKTEDEVTGGKKPFKMPDVGQQQKQTKEGKTELPGVLEKGSEEAWKKIMAVTYKTDGEDKSAEATAANTARTNELLKDMSDKLEETSI